MSKAEAERRGHRILRLPEVRQRTGLTSSTIYEMMRDGSFPKSIKIGLRAAGWVEQEVQKFIADRIAERDSNQAA
jgi:prophage regulatory protein